MSEQANSNKKKLKLILASLTIIALSIAGFIYWRYLEIYPSTDNAYIQGNIINIAPQIAGKIKQLSVANNLQVKQGQQLFSIDSEPYKIALNKARARLELDQKNADRIITLATEGRASKAEGDEAKAKLEVSKATLAEAELNLKYTQVAAPVAGTITNLTLREGDVVAQGNPLFALVETSHWWVDANYKETQLHRIRTGQAAEIKLDMYPGVVFHGVVDSISSGSGAAFSLLPPENATGNWVKVTQRFTVRVKLLEPDPLHPFRIGASSTVTINTAK
ncbi:MAG: emrA [Gammaproteobacteria bacterium]|jgi:membrane fusion protein (multidrug efflux system)|nr:emrA [Gammaproteobacteria bacterium]